MKKIKDENKILIMLALFSISIGLWENFRQLWLQSNKYYFKSSIFIECDMYFYMFNKNTIKGDKEIYINNFVNKDFSNVFVIS